METDSPNAEETLPATSLRNREETSIQLEVRNPEESLEMRVQLPQGSNMVAINNQFLTNSTDELLSEGKAIRVQQDRD